MKKLSLWAKHHKWQTRLVITLSFLALIGLGIMTGTLLNDLGVMIRDHWLWMIILIVLLAVIIYPERKRYRITEKEKNRHYFIQKSCDLALALSTYLLIVCLANQPQNILPGNHLFNKAIASTIIPVPRDSAQSKYQSPSLFQKSLRDENGKLLKWKERKKLLKVQVKAIRQSPELSDNGKAGLIILAVLIALGIALGIAALACSLSCGGSAIGTIALLSGLALFTVLLVMVIKKINRKKKNIPSADPPAGN